MIKRIIFDIDNTLIDFPKNYEEGYQKVLDKFNIDKTASELYKAIGKYETCGDYIFYNKEKMLELINKELNTNLEFDFIIEYLNMLNNLEVKVSDELKDTLKYLSEKYELVTLSNWFTDSQTKRLKKADILKYFTKVYGTDIVTMKPKKESFLSVIGDLKLDECLMVGDNLEVDIKVPYQMGVNVYHLNRFGTTKYPTIKKIEELKELL